ncbi:MAG: hypothetical protein Q4B30_01110 [Coriobacteriaceae bacterium]|nr:hypothetical protein [Coriobacteriaceae bacterium]
MRGCQLHRISYSVPDDGERDGIMFFTGSFRAPKNRPNSGFAPDEEVDYWEWHLERASNGEWVVLGKGVS